MFHRPCLSLFVALIVLAARVSMAGDVLFEDSRTDWTIYLSPQAGPMETFAAQELREALKKISGADFQVLTGGPVPDRKVIVIGDFQHPEVRARASELGLKEGKVEQLAVHTIGGRLYLAGNQPRGALYAVYHFLQHELGVRWLWPGTEGEFIPTKKRWELPELKFDYRPAIAYRGFHLCGDWRDVEKFRAWMARNFINLHRHAAPPQDQRRGLYSMWSSHNVRLPEKLFAEHPEYFAQIQGRRFKSNICFSHPEVDGLIAADTIAYVKKHPSLEILSLFPLDNQDYCRCEKCARSDVSTAWFEFYNRLTDTLKKEFPQLKFATIAYQGYRDVPKSTIRNSEFVEYASYTRCNFHPYGTPGCKHNEETMNEFLAWGKTGLPIGHYAYEYDVFARNCRFVPMLSVVADAVKTSHKLGHIAVIPEVSLSPKSGPDAYAHHVQNRLSIYLYARLLWNPEQSMDEVLADWCQTAFGEAAKPMQEYYTTMDRAWMAMPIHGTILGNALTAAPHLLTDGVRSKVAECFSAAQERAAKIADPALRERATAAILRERVLFNQWDDLRRSGSDVPRINLPLLSAAGDFAASGSRPLQLTADENGSPTRVSLAWTKDALLVKWICQEPQVKDIKAGPAEHDGPVTADDSVELLLSSGATGETWHFAVNTKGTQQDWRDSSVGVRDDRWDPAWVASARVGSDSWDVQMTIPFASIVQTPNPNEAWQANFLRRFGGRAGHADQAFPARESALLVFRSAGRTDRNILWWSGAPERESKRDPVLAQEFAEAGWQIRIVSAEENLRAIAGPSDAYWFRHPNGPSKVPADYWQKQLVPAVKNGALAVFVSYWDIPLDVYFNDLALKVKVTGSGSIPLAARVSTSIAPGDWTRKPNDLLGKFKTGITPAYGFIPADPSGWTILATAPGANNTTFPYLLARRYGKGMIVVAGDAIPISSAKLLQNLQEYHEHSKVSDHP